MASKLKTDVLETVSGSGTIALTNQLSGMTAASVPTLTTGHIPTLTTGHIPTLDHTKMPVGSVLQSVRSSSSSQTITTTSTSLVGTGIVVQITPKYANSVMHISFNSSMAYTNNTMMGRMYFKLAGGSYGVMNDSPASGGGEYALCYITSGQAAYVPIVCQLKYTCSALTTVFFQPYFKVGGGTGQVSHPSSSHSLTVTEIKQ